MSLPRLFVYPILITCIIGMSLLASAQTKQAKGDQSSNQWASHQMNQPPPDPTANRTLSQQRLDDITELVALAMKEIEEEQARKKAGPTRTPPDRPGQ